jgi:geranylgeranyl diphosphate synthase type II
MTPDVLSILKTGAALADDALERLLPPPTVEPHSIHRAMRHSTFAGGKRLRPILCMEAARCVAHELPPAAANLGAAIEMVHTYSLIHDDLPALDNDDLRRGKPTCHVAFGEAIAILAGDALQTLAFQTIAKLETPPIRVVQILSYFSEAIGTGVGAPTPLPPGMIGGQVMDIEGEGQKPTAELVERIHRAKTGALITTSIVCGGLLGLGYRDVQHAHARDGSPFQKDAFHGLPNDAIPRLRTFGEKAGLAFQIVDDILDVTQTSEQLGKTAGKDTATDKATWPAVYGPKDGVARSRHDANTLIQDAFAALEPFGPAADPLKALALYLVERTH